jgi:hypothetical protein
MTKLSTRVSDNNLIELAKKNYEQHQTSRIPGVIVELPSQGKVYPESNPCHTGKLEMRYMTAFDEDILTNGSYIKEGIVFDKLIDALVITTNFNVNTLIEADKEWILIFARIMGYGSEYPVVIKDPNGKKLSANIDLNKLQTLDFNLESDKNGEFDYEINSEFKIKYRYLPTSILNNIPEAAAVSYFLEQTICQINDNRDINHIKNFIKFQLTPVESRNLRKHIQITSPGIDLSYEFEYINEEGNKETFRARFPIGSDFFWI